MAMTTSSPLYSNTSQLQRASNNRTSFSSGIITTTNSGNSSNFNTTTTHHRKSAVELLAETKAFYVKSETVRGRTQTLPLLSHTSRLRRNQQQQQQQQPQQQLQQVQSIERTSCNTHHHSNIGVSSGSGGNVKTSSNIRDSSTNSTLIRRTTGASNNLHYHHGSGQQSSSNADMLQNALRKLLDCSSPLTSLENVTPTNTTVTSSSQQDYDMDCTTPISPPAEYAAFGSCSAAPSSSASASERRYQTRPTSATARSLSHSQPVSASSTSRSGGDELMLASPPSGYKYHYNDNYHSQTQSGNYRFHNRHNNDDIGLDIIDNGCCTQSHLVVLAKSLPDLHTTRNLSSSFEGSRSNKSVTSDVFSLNRDSGGDSSGRLTHKSEPTPTTARQHQQHPHQFQQLQQQQQPYRQSSTNNKSNKIDLRRDSGSSTQHSGSYYHSYYDVKHNHTIIYETTTKNYITTISTTTPVQSIGSNNYNSQQQEMHKNNTINTGAGTSLRYSTSNNPTNNYYGRSKQQGLSNSGYPISIARNEIVQSSNDSKIITQQYNARNLWTTATTSPSSSGISNKINNSVGVHPAALPPPIPAPRYSKSPCGGSGHMITPIFDTTLTTNNEIILPPPIECCDNYSQDNTSFMDTIIPPPVFEMENDNLEIKNLSAEFSSPVQQRNSPIILDKFKQQHVHHSYKTKTHSNTLQHHRSEDNLSETSFHENVAPTVRHSKSNAFNLTSSSGQSTIATSRLSANDDGPISLPFDDPELSPGPGIFKRQKCFRFKHKTNTSSASGSGGTTNSGRPILRSKSDISDRYRHNNMKSKPGAGGLIRKNCGGEITCSVSHLEQFFEQLGLNSDAYDDLFVKNTSNNNEDSDSPVYFSDVSTVDSNRPASHVDSGDIMECTTGGPVLGAQSNNIFRSNEQQLSIVERNARIIKWLCNCRKAQLAGSGTTPGSTTSPGGSSSNTIQKL